MKKTFKIAMVAACPFPCQRGTPIRIFQLAAALASRNHDVHVVTYHFGDPVGATPFAIHRARNVENYRVYQAGPTYRKLLVLDPLLTAKLWTLLRREAFDVIHAHHYEGLLVSLAARWRTRLPIVYDAHTLLGRELPFFDLGLPQTLTRGIGRFLDVTLPGTADHVVCVSSKIAKQLIECGVPAQDVTVAANGVEWERFDAIETRHPIREGDERTLVFCGNPAPYQGIELLLEAFQAVCARRNDVRLRIVSDFSFDAHEPLMQRLGIRKNIDVIQEQFEAVPGQLARADVALNPRTDCDGVPQKLLNYMASGTPVVSFEGSGEVLRHGETGLVVPNGDVAGFCDAILALLDDPELASKLGAGAKRQIAAEYHWNHTAEKVEAAYASVLARPRSS